MSYLYGQDGPAYPVFRDRNGQEVKEETKIAVACLRGDSAELRVGIVIKMQWQSKMNGWILEKVKMRWIDPVLKDSTLQGLDSRRVLVVE